jgi:hypothetical protein
VGVEPAAAVVRQVPEGVDGAREVPDRVVESVKAWAGQLLERMSRFRLYLGPAEASRCQVRRIRWLIGRVRAKVSACKEERDDVTS